MKSKILGATPVSEEGIIHYIRMRKSDNFTSLHLNNIDLADFSGASEEYFHTNRDISAFFMMKCPTMDLESLRTRFHQLINLAQGGNEK